MTSAVQGSHDANGKGAIHMVSAWATANRLVLAQVKVDANTQRVPDEITALPELLEQLAVAGCIVTIDAMGCQRAIAQQILEQDSDYRGSSAARGPAGDAGPKRQSGHPAR